MVRYLILNTPKLMETLGTYPRDTQEKLIEAVLAYGESNGEEPSEYGYRKEIFKEWQEVKPCLSWGDTIQEEEAKAIKERAYRAFKESLQNMEALKKARERALADSQKIKLEGNSEVVRLFNSMSREKQDEFIANLKQN